MPAGNPQPPYPPRGQPSANTAHTGPGASSQPPVPERQAALGAAPPAPHSAAPPAAPERPSGAQPATEPQQPATEPQQPATEPQQPATEPQQPATEPQQPATEPRQPATELRWTRRNVLIAGAALVASVGGAYWAMRSTLIATRAEQREQERQDWELPPTAGPAIRYRLYRESPLRRTLLALPAGLQPPEWFQRDHTQADRLSWIFDNGGAWVYGVSFRILVESLRRSVVVQSAAVRILRRTPPLDGTLVAQTGIGGPAGVITEIPATGANLDNDRPVLRMLEEADPGSQLLPAADQRLTLGTPFPNQQITLDAHAVQAIDVSAESHDYFCEWDLVLELSADGERVEAPISRDGKPFRTTGLARSYQSGLQEVNPSEDRGRLVADDPVKFVG
jgi:hypothetical protein